MFPYERWLPRVQGLAQQFRAAQPYPHVVLEQFLEPRLAEACLAAFPARGDDSWRNYTHVNERKFARSDQGGFPPTLQALIAELNSARFIRFLEALTGIEGLIADESLMGGGLHQSGNGGFLNVHADFTGHPHHERWRRRVNLLLYLNPGWQESYGGQLELWDKQMTRPVRTVAPLMNRALIFNTDPDSFHGHPTPMTCPEEFARRSIALYYFTDEKAAFRVRSTEYRSRPGDGARAAAIYLDKMVLRSYDKVKRTFRLNDDFASRLLRLLERRRKH
jgi:Rps23 Pro-64 3,4-dihydroxylase Tpa1-like proline 4-hydroxylase